VNGPDRLTQLAQRLQMLETDVKDLGSVLDDVREGNQHGSGGPPARRDGGGNSGGHAGDDEPVEPYFTGLLEFVTDGFAPVYCRPTSPTVRWCPRWWDHAEAIYRLEALWRTWELYRLEPRLGIASWLRDYLDPQLAALTSPTGPFAQCTDERHSPIKPLRTTTHPRATSTTCDPARQISPTAGPGGKARSRRHSRPVDRTYTSCQPTTEVRPTRRR